MKTTVEIPDKLFSQIKAYSSKRRKTLRSVIIEALQRIIHEVPSTSGAPEWLRAFGAFKDYGADNKTIEQAIEKEFSQVNSKEWE